MCPRAEKAYSTNGTFILTGLIYRKISLATPARSNLKYHTSLDMGEEEFASSLNLIPKTRSFTEMPLYEIGRMGERACFTFLRRHFHENIEWKFDFDITFKNEFDESFQPYDIAFTRNNIDNTFIDVKTTQFFENGAFHISLKEALFITKNYSTYYFARVFPLLENESYTGLKISRDLGMNIYQLHSEAEEEFSDAVNEMSEITGGEGFLLKTSWLKHVGIESLLHQSLRFYGHSGLDLGLLDYFPEIEVFGNEPYYTNIDFNSKINEIGYVLKKIYEVRERNIPFPPLSLRIEQIAQNCKCEILDVFLNQILEGKYDDQTVLYFCKHLLRINSLSEINYIIEKSKLFDTTLSPEDRRRR